MVSKALRKNVLLWSSVIKHTNDMKSVITSDFKNSIV